MKNKQSVFNVIRKYGKSKSRYLTPCFIFQVITAVGSVIPIYLLWKVVKVIFNDYPNFNSAVVNNYLLWAVIIQIIATFCAFFASILAHIMAFEVENGLRESGFSHLLDLPLGYFEENESGRLRKIIDDNASLTHSYIAHQVPDMIPGILIPLMVVASMFIIDWRFGLVLVFCLLLLMGSMAISFSPTNRKKMEEYEYALENINTEGVEYFRGIPVVKVFQQSVLSFNRFYKVIKDYEKYCLDYTVKFRNSYLLMNIALYLPYILIAILATLLVPNSNEPLLLITNAVFYILITIVFQMSLLRLVKLAMGSNNFNLAIDKINEITKKNPLPVNQNQAVSETEYSIIVDNVTFSYDGKRDVLKNLSFNFEKGKSYALVGKSGSGKTTLVNLISRFYDVNSGNILINGVDIKGMSEEEIFNDISIVFQQQKLLKDTIFENVRMYDETKTETDVLKALERANALEIVNDRKDGLFTIYGSKGTHFSGGEVQRISLARAFIKNKPILLLDEALAFVDADNELEILETIDRLKQDKTTIMILHRLSSAQSFDEIIMLDQGEILASGTHDELIKICKEYQNLYDEYQKTVKWRVKNA
ncbi:MAG: ABC transporter ATP-binding protein [Acholeplasmataceae bacterium]